VSCVRGQRGCPCPYVSCDDRAFQPGDATNPNQEGALVRLTITAGAPDAASPFEANGFPTGFPTCTADLGVQQVICTGLNDAHSYTLTDGGESVDGISSSGGAFTEDFALHRNDVVTLTNNAGGQLTALRVANPGSRSTGPAIRWRDPPWPSGPASSNGTDVFSSNNVDTANGVSVPALRPGNYNAIWTVGDPNGDTRTVTTRFIERSALQGPHGSQGGSARPQGAQGPQGPRGPQGPPGPKPKVTTSCSSTTKSSAR
jgi:hypothetical protein